MLDQSGTVHFYQDIDSIVDALCRSGAETNRNTRNAIIRTLQQLKRQWPPLPGPNITDGHIDIERVKQTVRQSVEQTLCKTSFLRQRPSSLDEPPIFFFEATTTAQIRHLHPDHSQGLKLLGRQLHVLLFDYLTIVGGSASGDILIPPDQDRGSSDAPTRLYTRYPITSYWAKEVLTKYGIEGVLIAFLLWKETLATILPPDWIEQLQEVSGSWAETPDNDSCMAISNVLSLIETDYLEDKLFRLGKWVHSPNLQPDELNKEVNLEWRDYLISALWGALKMLGPEEVARKVTESPAVGHEKQQITDADLVTLGIFFNELDWDQIALVLETDDHPRVLIANALTNIPALKTIAGNKGNFPQALETAINAGYIHSSLPAVDTESLPFSGPLRALHRNYNQARVRAGKR